MSTSNSSEKKSSIIGQLFHSEINLTPVNFTIAVSSAIIFFLIQLVGIYHHEPWNDEFQSFQIAMNSHSLSDLFFNIRQEGHGIIWYLILFITTRFTHNIFVMQLVHILIADGAFYILFRYGPFSLIEKILIGLGYFFFYEYAQISREYVIAVFSVICICAVIGEQYYRKKLSNQPIKYSLLFYSAAFFLLFLSGTSIYGFLLSIAIGIYFLWMVRSDKVFIFSDNKAKIPFGLSLLIILFGWIMFYFQMKPPTDNSFISISPVGFDLSRLGIVLNQLVVAYFPIPALNNIVCWNTYFIWPDMSTGNTVISIIVIALIAFLFINKRGILFFYLVSTFILGTFILYINLPVFSRYIGHSFFILFICFWLDRYIMPNQNSLKFIPDSVLVFIKKAVFYIFITGQAIAGIYFFCMDFNYPFANNSAAGDYVIQQHLDRFPIVGGTDYLVLPLSYYTHQPVFTFERMDTSRFVIYDNKKLSYIPTNDFFGSILNQVNKSPKDTILLCLSFELNDNSSGQSIPLEERNLDATHRIKSINKIDNPSLCKDQNYYFYLVWKGSM